MTFYIPRRHIIKGAAATAFAAGLGVLRNDAEAARRLLTLGSDTCGPTYPVSPINPGNGSSPSGSGGTQQTYNRDFNILTGAQNSPYLRGMPANPYSNGVVLAQKNDTTRMGTNPNFTSRTWGNGATDLQNLASAYATNSSGVALYQGTHPKDTTSASYAQPWFMGDTHGGSQLVTVHDSNSDTSRTPADYQIYIPIGAKASTGTFHMAVVDPRGFEWHGYQVNVADASGNYAGTSSSNLSPTPIPAAYNSGVTPRLTCNQSRFLDSYGDLNAPYTPGGGALLSNGANRFGWCTLSIRPTEINRPGGPLIQHMVRCVMSYNIIAAFGSDWQTGQPAFLNTTDFYSYTSGNQQYDIGNIPWGIPMVISMNDDYTTWTINGNPLNANQLAFCYTVQHWGIMCRDSTGANQFVVNFDPAVRNDSVCWQFVQDVAALMPTLTQHLWLVKSWNSTKPFYGGSSLVQAVASAGPVNAADVI